MKNDISIDSNECECLFVEILSKPQYNKQWACKNVIIVVVHKHPGNSFAPSEEKIEKAIQKLNHSNCSFFLVGDYNIDASKQAINAKVDKYLNDIYAAECCSLINIPTRLTSTTASTLDHIYTNILHDASLYEVLISDISDHLPTLCILRSNCYRNETNVKLTHDMKNFNAEAYCEDVYDQLQHLPSHADPNIDMSNLLHIIQKNTFNRAPLRKLSRKEMKAKSKPWLTKGLLKSISTKNKMFQLCYKQQNGQLTRKYKIYLHKLTKLKLDAKSMYYQNQLSSRKNDLSRQWSIINEVITNNQEMIAIIANSEKGVISDKSTICSVLNDFFINVSPTMDAKIAQPCKNFYIPSVMKSFAFEPITKKKFI